MINHHIQMHTSVNAERVTCSIIDCEEPFLLLRAGNVEFYLPLDEAAALVDRIMSAIASFQAAVTATAARPITT